MRRILSRSMLPHRSRIALFCIVLSSAWMAFSQTSSPNAPNAGQELQTNWQRAQQYQRENRSDLAIDEYRAMLVMPVIAGKVAQAAMRSHWIKESGHREAADSGIVDHLKEASTAAPELPERTRPSPSIHTPTATRTGRYPGHAPPGETRDIYKDVQPATVLIRCGSAVVKTRMVITRCSVWKLRITVDARSVTLSQRVRRGTALLRPS